MQLIIAIILARTRHGLALLHSMLITLLQKGKRYRSNNLAEFLKLGFSRQPSSLLGEVGHMTGPPTSDSA